MHKHDRGFTIVELLIVIVVIAILAAITIVAYNGIMQRATITSLQADLSTANKKLETNKTTNTSQQYAATLLDAGIMPKSGVTQDYYTSGSAFCVAFTTGSYVYHVENGQQITTGLCPVVTTFVGSTSGFANGTGTAAQFSDPQRVDVDSAGNLYIADTLNYRIRKVTPAGVVTTLAGSGANGFANGTGTAATFYGPKGIAVDSSGNVYVSDSWNNAIRKITPAGVVTTLAGGAYGSANGTGAAAQFGYPEGIDVDASGNVYVADTLNNRIRKITPAGVVTTFAGNTQGYAEGTTTSALFNQPYGVAVDSAGNVYVSDTANYRLRKLTSAGVSSTIAGSGTSGSTNGVGTAAQFGFLYGLSIDAAGNIYAADGTGFTIRKITSAGVVTTLAGNGNTGSDDGLPSSVTFSNPWDTAVDPSTNTLYIVDRGNNRIRKMPI